MNKELIVYYIKRHGLVIIGLLLAGGFVGYGFKFKGDAQARAEEAAAAFDTATENRKNIYTPADNIRIDEANVSRYQDETTEMGDLIVGAESVISSGEDLVPFENSIEFKRHLASVIRQLSLKAKERGVELLRDPTNKSVWKDLDYFFTFYEVMTKKHGVPENMMGELQIQLKDVEAIINIVLDSRVQSLELLQRNPVTGLDFSAQSKRDYISVQDRNKYTNSVAVIRPYRIKFHCLSEGIANVLSGLAKEDLFYVVRKLEVTQAKASGAGGAGGMGGMGGMGMGGMGMGEAGGMGGPGGGMGGPGGGRVGGGPGGGGPGGGGPGGGMGVPGGGAGGPGGAQASSGTVSMPLTASEHQLLETAIRLATPKAKSVMREELLEVTIDVDVIRKIRQAPAPGEAGGGGAGGANGANPGMPPVQPAGLSGSPPTNNPAVPPSAPGTNNTNTPAAPAAPQPGS